MHDVVSYFRRTYPRTCELPPDVEYDTTPDSAAIANLEAMWKQPMPQPPRRTSDE